MIKIMSGLTISLLIFCTFQAAKATVIPYPRVPGDLSNSDFSITVNKIPVDSARLEDMNVGYAHFAFSGTVTVEITIEETIATFDLSPHRYGIQATANGNVLSFQLSQPRKLHLKINNLPRFFIFADAPEMNPPQLGQPGVYDLRDYDVSSSSELVQTTKIQNAINEVASQGDILYVPPGIYRSGQLKMKSNLSLYLAPGAIIKGTGKVEDYPREELGTQQIYLLDCENVRIGGRGVVDGRGKVLRLSTDNSNSGRMKLIRSFRAKDCIVQDVILRDAGSWAIHLVESSELRFNNYKLISNTILDNPSFPWEPNTDGFDPDNSNNVIIENGFVSCSDDAIAVKLRHGNLSNMDNIQFRSNVVWTCKSALKIGTEVYDFRMTNIVFEDNEVIHADRGISIYCYRGATIENPKWINNYFEYIGDNIKEMNINIQIKDVEGKGYINNVLIKDNTFENFGPNKSVIYGLDNEHMIDGITFDNLIIAGKRRISPEDAQINIKRYAKNVSFETDVKIHTR